MLESVLRNEIFDSRCLSRRFCLHPDLRLEDVAALCPANLTGADFYALCSDAMLQSVKRKVELLEQGDLIGELGTDS